MAVRIHLVTLASLLPIVTLSSTVCQAQTLPAYRLSRSVALGVPDRWDYLTYDPESDRVFVAHGDRVTIVYGRTGEIVGQVTGLPGGTHGIAIVSNVGRGYTDDGRAGEAASFDLKTLQIEKRIKTAPDADGIVYDPVSQHVFVVNGDSGSVTVIDPHIDSAIAAISVGGGLEFAVPGGNGKLYVNGAERKEIVRIDVRSNQVDARWPVPQCTSPHGIAIDAQTHRLFVSCVNSLLTVVDSDSGTVIASLPIGIGSDAAAFDPTRRLVFSSNGRDGTLSVIQERDAHTFVPVGNIRTALTARTMTIDPKSGRIYLVAAEIEPPPTGVATPATSAARRRGPAIVPGSLKLLFLDPPQAEK